MIVAISPESPDALASLQAGLAPTIRLLADPELNAIRAYGLEHREAAPGGKSTARPATFVIGSDGRIVASHVAGDTLDRPDPAWVLDALQAAR